MKQHIPYAVIDIGSNSLRLMTGIQNDTGQWCFSPKVVATTRLGNAVEETRHLWPEGMEASFAVMDEWMDIVAGMHVCAVATSAVREAKDGQAFLAEIRARYGWHCRTVTGNGEAELSFCGAASRLGQSVKAGVLDIGGGSSEFAVGTNGIAAWSHSYPLGAVRLAKQDTWSIAELQQLKEHCLRTLLPMAIQPETIIGVGGTLTTLAAMDLRLQTYDAAKVEGHVVSRETIGMWIDALQAMDPETRRNVPGLQPKRSDIIIPGLVIAWAFLTYYDQPSLTVSERDLMEGIYYRRAFYDAAWRMGADNTWD